LQKRPGFPTLRGDSVTIHGYQTSYHPRNPDGSRSRRISFRSHRRCQTTGWAKNVYQPDVVNNSEKLYKKLGYMM